MRKRKGSIQERRICIDNKCICISTYADVSLYMRVYGSLQCCNNAGHMLVMTR